MILAVVMTAAFWDSAQAKNKLALRKTKKSSKFTNKANIPMFVSRELQACSLGEGSIECDAASAICQGGVINNCEPVYCVDDYSCDAATITNSKLFCQSSYSCTEAYIKDSNVVCSDWYSCNSATIRRSFVYCASENSCTAKLSSVALSCGSEFNSCAFNNYDDQCSCCDGAGCPSELQKCRINNAPNAEFCSSESSGITCAALGNPICEGMPGYPTSEDTDQDPTDTLPPQNIAGPDSAVTAEDKGPRL
jgi:hypothetical protein